MTFFSTGQLARSMMVRIASRHCALSAASVCCWSVSSSVTVRVWAVSFGVEGFSCAVVLSGCLASLWGCALVCGSVAFSFVGSGLLVAGSARCSGCRGLSAAEVFSLGLSAVLVSGLVTSTRILGVSLAAEDFLFFVALVFVAVDFLSLVFVAVDFLPFAALDFVAGVFAPSAFFESGAEKPSLPDSVIAKTPPSLRSASPARTSLLSATDSDRLGVLPVIF